MTEGTCNPSAEDAEMGGGVPSVYWLASLAGWVRSSSVTVSVSPPKQGGELSRKTRVKL